MSAAARVGAYYARSMALARGTELQNGVARVVGELVGLADQGEGVHVSGSSIARIAFDRGVRSIDAAGRERPVSLGLVVSVLEALRAIGVIAWDRAYNSRWHEPGNPDGWIRVQLRGDEYRFPPRRLTLVGAATAVARGIALAAVPIDAVRSAAEKCARALGARTRPVPRTSVPQVCTPAELPIGSALEADRSALGVAVRRWLDAQRE